MSVGYTTAKRIQVLTGHKKGHVSGLATASEGVLKHREDTTPQNGENVKMGIQEKSLRQEVHFFFVKKRTQTPYPET